MPNKIPCPGTASHQIAGLKFLSVLLLLAALASLTQCEHLRTPTGIEIPLEIIRTALPQQLHHEAQNHIYDVNHEGDVIGPNVFKLPLSRLSPEQHIPINVHSSFHATFNGYPYNHIERNTTKTKMGEYTAVHTGHSKKLLGLWGPNLHLSPINHAKHPFTFVNSFRKITDQVTVKALTPPMEVADGSADFDASEDGNLAKNSRQIIGDCASGTIHYMEVYAVFDNTFCSLFGEDERSAISVLQASFDIIQKPFLDTCVRPTLIGVEAHCNDPNDPYSSIVGADSLSILQFIRADFT